MFTLYEMSFRLKFLGLTVKFGQTKNKTDNIKIVRNLVTELKSYLKRYLKRKYSLKALAYLQNKQERRKDAYPR